MALTITEAAFAESDTNNTTLVTGTFNASVGDWLVALASSSNAGTSGAASLTGISDSAGNIWSQKLLLNRDPGAVNQGITLGVWICEGVTNAISGGTVSAGFGNNTPEKGITVIKVVPGSGEAVSLVAADGTGTSGGSNAAAGNTVSVTNGDTVIGACAAEARPGNITEDSDTTNGSWSAAIKRGADGGPSSGNAGSAIIVEQHKTVNSTGNQTYNNSFNISVDWCTGYVILRAVATAREIDADAGSYALTGTAATLERGRKVAAAPGGYGLMGPAALLKHGWKAAVATGSYAIGGQAVGLLATKNVVTDPDGYVLTGQGSVLSRGFSAAAASGSYGVWGQDAALITAANRIMIAAAGGYGLSGAAGALLHRREVPAGVAAYALEGQHASLLRARRAAAGAGGYSLTGLDLGLTLAPAPPPEATARRHAADDRQEYERWLREWQEKLRRIIERSWRIANGEIDPVTLEPIPPPDLQGLAAALELVEEARDRAALDAAVAGEARRQEEEAIAVLLLAA